MELSPLKLSINTHNLIEMHPMQMGGKLLRSIGLDRAEVNLGLKNLTYNFMRLIFWETQETVLD
jgi:hypothetical protein